MGLKGDYIMSWLATGRALEEERGKIPSSRMIFLTPIGKVIGTIIEGKNIPLNIDNPEIAYTEMVQKYGDTVNIFDQVDFGIINYMNNQVNSDIIRLHDVVVLGTDNREILLTNKFMLFTDQIIGCVPLVE